MPCQPPIKMRSWAAGNVASRTQRAFQQPQCMLRMHNAWPPPCHPGSLLAPSINLAFASTAWARHYPTCHMQCLCGSLQAAPNHAFVKSAVRHIHRVCSSSSGSSDNRTEDLALIADPQAQSSSRPRRGHKQRVQASRPKDAEMVAGGKANHNLVGKPGSVEHTSVEDEETCAAGPGPYSQLPQTGTKGHRSAGPPLKLPEAYSTVLTAPASRSQRAQGSLVWTDDDRLEAADRAAIRRAEAARLASHSAAQAALPPAPTVITRLPAHLSRGVLDNAMVLLDKPLLWEAEEVARSLRWCLPVERLGYVGGLDAGATGLMILLMGKATALTGMINKLGSRYTATVRLGVATDTHDAAGRTTDMGPWQHVSDESIQQVAARLQGRQVQVPPPISAVRVKGRPVYELAKHRAAEEMLPRPVTITDLRVERVEPGGRDLRLDVTFARAGFVHSLAHDIGHHLGCGAHVTSLRREAIGGFLVDNAWTLDVLLPVARQLRKKAKKRKGLPKQAPTRMA